MKKERLLIATIFIFLSSKSMVSNASSICEDVLKYRAFNTTDYSTSEAIYESEYNNICLREFETIEEIKSSASDSSFGAKIKGVPLEIGHASKNSRGYYSLKDTKYCETLEKELLSISQVNFKKTFADVAVKAWEGCIEKLHGSKLYVKYTPLANGLSVNGTLVRTVGSSGGFGNITSFSATGLTDSSVVVECKIGADPFPLDKKLRVPIIKTHTNFSCTKNDKSKSVAVSIATDQDDVTIYMPSEKEQDLNIKIADLTKKVDRKQKEISQLESEISQLDNKLQITGSELLQLKKVKPSQSSMVLRGLTGAHPLKFQSQAFPESKKITVTVSFVDVASDSCTFHLTDGQELINCDKSIKATPGNIYHIEGNMILDQARGAIRFTGMAVLSNIAHIDFNDATVLVAR